MLYPEIESYHSGFLDVSNRHRIHYQLAGNPDGIPVIFLHGGPGAGVPPGFARFFDPNVFKIIGFDQRGCGRSTPTHDLSNNNTSLLLQDIAALKKHLEIDSWVVFGGSWGATLALLLSISQPESVKAIILRGTFLARDQDFAWFLSPNGGAAKLYPDQYELLIKPIGPVADHRELCEKFMVEFTCNNELRRTSAIRAWFQWEERLSCLSMPVNYSTARNTPLSTMADMAMLECHYLLNQCFIEENFILDNIEAISSIPGTIIHGRYDTICSTSQAFELHKKWNNSQLNIVPAAGHSTAEPAIGAALCQATRSVAKFLKRP